MILLLAKNEFHNFAVAFSCPTFSKQPHWVKHYMLRDGVYLGGWFLDGSRYTSWGRGVIGIFADEMPIIGRKLKPGEIVQIEVDQNIEKYIKAQKPRNIDLYEFWLRNHNEDWYKSFQIGNIELAKKQLNENK